MEAGALCGMTESEFWNSTPRFMAAKLKALELRDQLSWEQSRFIAFFGSRASGKRLLSFYRFPWEAPKVIKLTDEELVAMRKFSAEADEVLKQWNPAAYEVYITAQRAKQNGEGVSDQAKN